jgi:pyrroloquinoline quinone (PQQ) biosynthesis protein C
MAAKANRIGVRTADKIIALREQWHTKNHPFFVDFWKGKFGLKPVGRMMAQHYQHVYRVLPCQGFAYAKAPADGRRHILANVAEEEGLIAGPGEDREPHDHMEMIFRFCRYAGLTDKEVKATEQLPAWRARSYFYINTVREEPFPVIVAMQSTQEGQQPALNGERMLPAFKKHFGLEMDDPRIEFFAEHYLADADHSSRQIEMVTKYITNDELAARALQVAETMVKTRWAGITEVYRTAVLGERDPLPKGIAA